MRKVLLVLALVSVLALALGGSGSAADLKAGWYVSLGGVYVGDYDGTGLPYTKADGWFSTPTGQYGPFVVGSGTPPSRFYRSVTVQTDVQSVGSDQSLDLPVAFGLTIGEHIGWLSIGWDTDYEPSQMFLELWKTRYDGSCERVWSQQTSGRQFGNTDILQDTTIEGPFFFRINVVPEPSSLLALVISLGITSAALIRRRS